jgi:hypothetical protein
MIRRQVKFLREGEYAAEVEVELIGEGEGWGPYLSLKDAEKLDAVREALWVGQIEEAARFAKIFRLVPVAVLLHNSHRPATG